MFVDKKAILCGKSSFYVGILSAVILFLHTYPRKKYKNCREKSPCGQSYPHEKVGKIKGFRRFL